MTEAAVATLLAPALFAAAVIAILRHMPWIPRLADHPNERSLHAQPTPRIGGLGLAAAVMGGGLVTVLASAITGNSLS